MPHLLMIKGDLDLPPAVAIKIDPLIAGMQTNPVNEVIRLQNFLADNKDMSSETEARVKNMINVQQNIIDRIEDIFRNEKHQNIVKPLIKANEVMINGQFQVSLDLYNNRGWLEKMLG